MADRFQNDDGCSIFNESVIDIDLDDDRIDLDLADYEEEEIKHINEVMIKDKSLRAEERERKRKIEEAMDESIMTISMKNVDSGDKHCLVCSEKFSMFMNPRKICTICEKGVCGSCLDKFHNNDFLVCKICFLNSTRDGKTGKWFYSVSKTNGRFRRSASLIIMNSIRKIKSKFSHNPNAERMSLNKHEPIKPMGNGDMHQPLYMNKKNSPKPPRKSNLEKEAIQISANATPDIDLAYDTVDGRNLDADDKRNSARRSITEDSNHNQAGVHSNLGSMQSLSGSMMSVYSEADESYRTGIPVSGDISMSVYYDDVNKSLIIHVDQCRNIAVADRKKKRTDPYIKTYLLPDKTKISKKKSTTKKMTVNPVYNEKLTYFISRNELGSRTISISVWHKSSFLKYNIFLGEVQLVLADMDLAKKECCWVPFHEKRKYPMRSAGMIFKGELSFKLKYKPSTRKDGKGTLHVFIVGATKLESDRASVNSYVKGYLLPDKDHKSKGKTSVFKNTLNPSWNSLMQFSEVSLAELRDRSLELSIYHQNKLKVNEFLGGVRLNLGLGLHSSEHVQWMDAQGAEKQAWENFLSNPYEYCDVTLHLRPNLDF